MADVGEFMDALSRVAAGGTALDSEVVSQLVATSGRGASLGDSLTPREGEVLSLRGPASDKITSMVLDLLERAPHHLRPRRSI